MGNNNIQKIRDIAVIIGVLLISISISTYYLYLKPQQEKKKFEAEQTASASRNKNFLNCIVGEENNYNTLWETRCRQNNLDKNCNLPSEEADYVEKKIDAKKELCAKLFK